LRCDIFDFGEREIRRGQVESVQYTARRIPFGGIPTIAIFVLAVIVWALVVGLRKDRIAQTDAIMFACVGGLFGVYVLQRVWHCARNKRRVVTLTLTDGTTGTFIELEDERTFQTARRVLDEFASNPSLHPGVRGPDEA